MSNIALNWCSAALFTRSQLTQTLSCQNVNKRKKQDTMWMELGLEISTLPEYIILALRL